MRYCLSLLLLFALQLSISAQPSSFTAPTQINGLQLRLASLKSSPYEDQKFYAVVEIENTTADTVFIEPQATVRSIMFTHVDSMLSTSSDATIIIPGLEAVTVKSARNSQVRRISNYWPAPIHADNDQLNARADSQYVSENKKLDARKMNSRPFYKIAPHKSIKLNAILSFSPYLLTRIDAAKLEGVKEIYLGFFAQYYLSNGPMQKGYLLSGTEPDLRSIFKYSPQANSASAASGYLPTPVDTLSQIEGLKVKAGSIKPSGDGGYFATITIKNTTKAPVYIEEFARQTDEISVALDTQVNGRATILISRRDLDVLNATGNMKEAAPAIGGEAKQKAQDQYKQLLQKNQSVTEKGERGKPVYKIPAHSSRNIYCLVRPRASSSLSSISPVLLRKLKDTRLSLAINYFFENGPFQMGYMVSDKDGGLKKLFGGK